MQLSPEKYELQKFQTGQKFFIETLYRFRKETDSVLRQTATFLKFLENLRGLFKHGFDKWKYYDF